MSPDARPSSGPVSVGPVRPFRIHVSDEVLADLAGRLHAARRIEFPVGEPRLGIDLDQLQALASYWRDEFDWRNAESRLNRLDHILVEVDGMDVHAVHARGDGPDPVPVVITHGWPSSFAEIIPVVDLLSRPGDHGGDPDDAFDVVLPSLPGYVFSAAPAELADATAARIARRLHGVMAALGYGRYGASGGDVGARVTAWMGAQEPAAVLGIHVSAGAISPEVANDDAEAAWHAEEDRFWRAEGGYFEIQRSKPRSMAMALRDSPIGLAAWIVEKWTDWGDTGGDALARFGHERLLTNVMLYWITASIGSSLLTYAAFDLPPGPRPPPGAVTVPTGFYLCEREPRRIPPRRWAERQFPVARWSVMGSGGHFLPAEEPEAFAEDLRDFFRPYRRAIR